MLTHSLSLPPLVYLRATHPLKQALTHRFPLYIAHRRPELPQKLHTTFYTPRILLLIGSSVLGWLESGLLLKTRTSTRIC